MVNFIKPSYLGTEKEFANLYANPIKNGQHKDSDENEIKIMKQRSYVLHKKLSKFVQRREAALLKTFLPEKFEFVLFVPMSPIQESLYEYFLQNKALRLENSGKSLIPDYTCLRKVFLFLSFMCFIVICKIIKFCFVFLDMDPSKSIGKCMAKCYKCLCFYFRK